MQPIRLSETVCTKLNHNHSRIESKTKSKSAGIGITALHPILPLALALFLFREPVGKEWCVIHKQKRNAAIWFFPPASIFSHFLPTI